MTTATIIEQALADGVTLSLTTTGTIRAAGNREAIGRWQSILTEHKPGIVAVLLEAANDSAAHFRWTVQFPNLPAMEVAITPEATRDEVLALYPGAAVSALPEPPQWCPSPTAAADNAPSPAAEARRQRVLRLLESNHDLRIAIVTDIAAEPEVVIVTIAVRGRATGEISIPTDRYDPRLLSQLMDAHSGPVPHAAATS